jgi:hypothetical protein
LSQVHDGFVLESMLYSQHLKIGQVWLCNGCFKAKPDTDNRATIY